MQDYLETYNLIPKLETKVDIVICVIDKSVIFQALKIVSQSASPRTKTIIFGTYWALSILAIVVILILPNIHFEKQARFVRSTIFAIIVGLFL